METNDLEEPEHPYDEEELKTLLAKEVQEKHDPPLPSFEHVVKKYRPACYWHAMSIIKQHETAEEVVRDAFVNAYLALNSYPPDRIRAMHLRAWLLKITSNEAKTQWNRQRVRQGRETSLENLEPLALERLFWQQSGDVETSTERKEKFKAFMKAFQALSKDEQIALHMKIELSLEYEEISRILNEVEGTIKARISRARKKLRELLGTDYPEYLD